MRKEEKKRLGVSISVGIINTGFVPFTINETCRRRPLLRKIVGRWKQRNTSWKKCIERKKQASLQVVKVNRPIVSFNSTILRILFEGRERERERERKNLQSRFSRVSQSLSIRRRAIAFSFQPSGNPASRFRGPA